MIGAAQLIGAQLGNYEIQSLLGSGGMASVYRAFDRNLQRPVAIKVLSDPAQTDFAARFLQEARLIAGLRHPNIVQVYDYGQHDGLSYMVQELLSGPTLQSYLRDLAARGEQLARDDVLAIIRQLAGALDAAHAAGIIHRDVKPANAIWNAAGALVLTDFGIAKNSQLPDLTQAGQVIGTPDYLSPEQAKGLPLTPSSDIYSLGVVLYEMLAGRLPFAGGTALGVAMSHIYDAPPPLRQFRPDLPVALEALLQQALAKDPSARFRSAGALAQALSLAWPANGNVAAPSTGIHEQPTAIWAARPEPVARPIPAPIASSEDAHPAAPPVPQTSSPSRTLRVLLVALLIGGALLLGRALWPPAELAPVVPPAETAPVAAQPTDAPVAQATAAPTAAPAPTEPPATAPPEPTAAPAPTEEPATAPPEPTAAPAPTEVPPTAPPAPSDPVDQLRVLLEAGRADGRAGRSGGAMLSDLSKAKQALDDGNKSRAADRLHDLQKRLLDGVKSKRVDADFARQALAGIDTIAAANGLELPPQREGGDNKDK